MGPGEAVKSDDVVSESFSTENQGANSLATQKRNDEAVSTRENNDDGKDTDENDPWANTEFPDPDINTPTALESISWWAEFTSVHGVYYAFERGHFRAWKQISWCILTIVTAGLLIWVLVLEFQAYYEYNVNTSMETIVPISLSFPQVTVCNHNMFDQSLQNSTGISEPSNEAELNAISQPFSEFIQYTSFNGISFENLTEAWSPVITPYGRCFNFNTNENVFKPGGTAGLNMWMWLNQSNYEDSTETAGVDVYVTQPGSAITDQGSPVSVPPGGASNIVVSLIQFQREREKPWSRCFGSAPQYSNEVCRADCINRATRENCECRLIGDDVNKTMRYCESTDDACISTIGDPALIGCDCATPPCEEDIYITRYSAAQISFKAQRIIEYEERLPDGDVSLNFVAVSLNFDSIRFERNTESKATSTPSLISNLGGNMGFFMGLSMISVVEIFVELMGLRLIPRLWGDRRLYGIGQKKTD